MADRDEHALHVDFAPCAVLRVLDAHARDAAVVADDLVEHVIVEDVDVAGAAALDELVDHDLLGAELVAPMHDA